MKKDFIKKIVGNVCTTFACVLALGLNADAKEVLTNRSATEIVSMMDKGYNIGNTLDATGGRRHNIEAHETSWGNPAITRELIHGIKEAGFNTVRIPTTWYHHIAKDGTYAIDQDFLDRVREVIDWCYEEDLFIIINVHHEEWVNVSTLDTTYKEIGEELSALWSQVANEYSDYDQHLIFEGMNEPRAVNTNYEWTGNAACYDAINYLNQLFVNAVRDNGKGNNADRLLMIPGYAASNSSNVLKSIVLPTYNGETANNLVISVHCYSPYNFCLSDAQVKFDENNSNDTSDIKRMFNELDSLFIKNDIPVIIGECGCTNSNNNTKEREKWFAFFGKISKQYGVPAIVWDNGSGGNSGGECHKYFKRRTGEVLEPTLISAFINGEIYKEPEVIADTKIDFEPYKNGEELVLVTPESVGFTSPKLTKANSINHTADASIGFSVKVDSIVNYEAALDISKYAGHNLAITINLLADDNECINLGVLEGDQEELHPLNLNKDWKEVSFTAKVKEDTKTYIVFKGTNDITFYIDDIDIKLVGDDVNIELSDEPIITETEANVTVSAAADSEADADEVAVVTKAETNVNMLFIVAIAGVLLLALVVCIIVIIKRKR